MAALNVQIDNQIKAKGDKDFANSAGHIPCFYNDAKVDSLTAKLFLTKIDENIANGWVTADNAYIRFPTVLKGNAKQWYDYLVSTDAKPADWVTLRAKFIKDYDIVLSSLSAVEGMARLTQKSDESVIMFKSRVTAAVAEIHKTFEMPTDVGFAPLAEATTFLQTGAAGLAERNAAHHSREVLRAAAAAVNKFKLNLIKSYFVTVSYTHLTLPTIYSV